MSNELKDKMCLVVNVLVGMYVWEAEFVLGDCMYSRTCLGQPLVWATTRLGRPQSPARIVSNNKVPGVSDHLPDATSDRVVWFNQRYFLPAMNDRPMRPVEISDNNVVCEV